MPVDSETLEEEVGPLVKGRPVLGGTESRGCYEEILFLRPCIDL